MSELRKLALANPHQSMLSELSVETRTHERRMAAHQPTSREAEAAKIARLRTLRLAASERSNKNKGTRIKG
jgi:hypothetical protein